MKYFQKYFSEADFNTGAEEVKVLCPFHNDTKPSASVNTQKGLFKCWVCGNGYNEVQFLSKTSNIPITEAHKLLAKMSDVENDNWEYTAQASLWANNQFRKEVADRLHISEELMEELKLGITTLSKGDIMLGIPVYFNDILMDVRSYNVLKLEGLPKLMARPDSQSGLIVPFDIWKSDTSTTYIFEGEKDMMLARDLGLNAITLTGGAGAKPSDLVLNSFKDRDIIICYDNDKAGRDGANKLHKTLAKIANSVKYINIAEEDIGVKEEKEDFFDFIVKYNNSIFDFYNLTVLEFKNEVKKDLIPLKAAVYNNQIKKNLVSQINVSAEFEDNFAVPQLVEFEKVSESEDGRKVETMFEGEKRIWTLEDKNATQMLELVETDSKKNQVLSKLKSFAGIPEKEPFIEVKISQYATVYKCRIMDVSSKGVEAEKTVQIDLYSFRPMIVGKQYEIEYKIYPHPTKNQKLVAVAHNVKEVNNIEDFVAKPELLSKFQTKGTIEERLDVLYQSAKHHIAKHLNYDLWLITDLVFNSINTIQYGVDTWGMLDVFILGDTQVGKSETTSHMVDLYNFGHFLSLKTSSTVGLIGGSNKVEGSWLNTIGAIPRQHNKLVVMEEFSGAKPEFLKTMTDMRSARVLRLARAAGELNVPVSLRMITISNPINDDNGNPRHLSTFPNGVKPLMELLKSAEDVARYDLIYLAQKPSYRVNPFSYKLKGEPIEKEAYEHKSQWVYTRTKENVKFEEGVESYIWEKAEELNQIFESNFPLFGTTTSLKLARLSVALASLLTNTDNYQDIIVTKEMVDYMKDYLISIYDNDVFKLKEYKEEYDSYSTITDEECDKISDIYGRNVTMFEFLAHQSDTSRSNLRSVSGLDGDKFNPVFNNLVRYKLIRLNGETVFPTPKFRLAMERIDKTKIVTQGFGGTLVQPDNLDQMLGKKGGN